MTSPWWRRPECVTSQRRTPTMAAARDSDISLWLHNKLGTSADTWSEGSICSQLNVEVLRNIKECFVELQTQVKLKLLLSFFHIPKRNVEEVGRWEVLCESEWTRVSSVPRLTLLMMLLLSPVCPDTLSPDLSHVLWQPSPVLMALRSHLCELCHHMSGLCAREKRRSVQPRPFFPWCVGGFFASPSPLLTSNPFIYMTMATKTDLLGINVRTVIFFHGVCGWRRKMVLCELRKVEIIS